MKKSLIAIILIFIIIIALIIGLILNNVANANRIRKHNEYYENYYGTVIMGTELATLINRVMDLNRRNNIEQDENRHFINNDINSIKIYVEMATIEATFTMESLYNVGITEFVQAFNFASFKCIGINYHEETGKISQMIFVELED
ncbi:MAG: hypothetical protein FWC68_00395 [Oscillospiraceae bacterium]|nr:hypothetical protein [Oscillospiraceae bacterium]